MEHSVDQATRKYHLVVHMRHVLYVVQMYVVLHSVELFAFFNRVKGYYPSSFREFLVHTVVLNHFIILLESL